MKPITIAGTLLPLDVEQRYPGDAVYRGEHRAAKVRQVESRCKVAEALRHGVCNLEVIEEEAR
jgi:hypothetical protein